MLWLYVLDSTACVWPEEGGEVTFPPEQFVTVCHIHACKQATIDQSCTLEIISISSKQTFYTCSKVQQMNEIIIEIDKYERARSCDQSSTPYAMQLSSNVIIKIHRNIADSIILNIVGRKIIYYIGTIEDLENNGIY